MEQKFTQMAQEALSDAVQNAAALGNPQVDTLHLLDAMLRQENSMARALIEAAGGNAQNVSAEVHQAMQSLPSASGSTTTQPDVSRQLSAVLSQAEKEMQRRGDEYVTVDLMLVAIAAAKPNQSADILEKNGLTADKLRNALTAARGSDRKVTSADAEGSERVPPECGFAPSGGVFCMAEIDPPGKGQQAGGGGTVFPEPETAAYGISGLWRCPYLQ